jgi:hypothetical protein
VGKAGGVDSDITEEGPAEAGVPRIRVPRTPHMDEVQVVYLQEKLEAASCFLEYGAGGSTVMAATIGVPTIVSVESSREFARAVRKKVKRLGGETALHMHAINIGPTGNWGFPTDRSRAHKWSDYVLSPWRTVHDLELQPDIVLIDGRFRAACLYATLLAAPMGTTILFDDYTRERRRYKEIESYLVPDEIIGRMAVFTRPAAIDEAQIAFALAAAVSDPS